MGTSKGFFGLFSLSDLLVPNSDQQLKLYNSVRSQCKALTKESLYTGADRNYQLSSSRRCTFFHTITSLKLCVPLLTLSEYLTFYVLYIRSLLKASKQPLEYYYLSRFMDEGNKVQRSWKTHLRSHRTRKGSVWPEWLCPQIHMLKPNNQWDGSRRWDC